MILAIPLLMLVACDQKPADTGGTMKPPAAVSAAMPKIAMKPTQTATEKLWPQIAWKIAAPASAPGTDMNIISVSATSL